MNSCRIHGIPSESVPPNAELDSRRMSQRTHVPTPMIQRGGSYREASGPSRKHRLSALRSVSLKQVGAFVIVALFTSSLAFVLTSIPAKTTAFNLREPIFITSDTAFPAENGVVAGSGTADDPYVIAGWEISVDRKSKRL